MPTESEIDAGTLTLFAQTLTDFLQQPAAEVHSRLAKEAAAPGSLVAAAWRQAAPVSRADIERFYRETDAYLFDLAVDHSRRGRWRVMDVVFARLDRLGHELRVAMYGDGIGTDSLALADRGHRVTYFDLPGLSSRFAQFRFAKSPAGRRITVVDSASDLPSDSFDAVISIEVLEHATEPLGCMRDFYRILRDRGVALITESFGAVGPEFPSHLPANAVYAGQTFRLMESLGFANTFYNLDPLNYPMEFQKVERTLLGSGRIYFLRARRALARRLRPFWRAAGFKPH